MRILRKRECSAKTGLSVPHLDRIERLGRFPKRVPLGPRAIGWLEFEIDAWIGQRVAERDEAACHASAPAA